MGENSSEFWKEIMREMSFSDSSDGKESACNAEDPSSIHGSGKSSRERATPSSILTWRTPRTEVRHDWATNTKHTHSKRNNSNSGRTKEFLLQLRWNIIATKVFSQNNIFPVVCFFPKKKKWCLQLLKILPSLSIFKWPYFIWTLQFILQWKKKAHSGLSLKFLQLCIIKQENIL